MRGNRFIIAGMAASLLSLSAGPGRRTADLSRRRHLLRQRDGRLRRGLQIGRPSRRPVPVLQVGRRQRALIRIRNDPDWTSIPTSPTSNAASSAPSRPACRCCWTSTIPTTGPTATSRSPQGLGQAVDARPGQGAVRLHPRHPARTGPRGPDARAGAGGQRDQRRDRLQPGQGERAHPLGAATPCCSTPGSRPCATPARSGQAAPADAAHRPARERRALVRRRDQGRRHRLRHHRPQLLQQVVQALDGRSWARRSTACATPTRPTCWWSRRPIRSPTTTPTARPTCWVRTR